MIRCPGLPLRGNAAAVETDPGERRGRPAATVGRGIAALAESGLGYLPDQALVASHFYPLLFSGTLTLGQVCTQAKIRAYGDGASAEVLETFTLIGDPAMRLKLAP